MTILLSKRRVAARLGWHPEHVMREARAGRFPKPIKLGPTAQHAVRFVEDEVEEWLHRRIEARDRRQPAVV